MLTDVLLPETGYQDLTRSADEQLCADSVLRIMRGETLFETGDLKANFYRVDNGTVCVYTLRWDGSPEHVAYATAGDYVGMGFLDRHASTARATVDAVVTALPLAGLDQTLESDANARSQFDAAMQREFAIRRDALVRVGRGRPLVRVAAFLVAVSRRNRGEGSDPNTVNDALDCTVIADYLDLSLDPLSSALVQLEMRGLVKPGPDHTLSLIDVEGLEALANEGAHVPDLPVANEAGAGAGTGSLDVTFEGQHFAEYAFAGELLMAPERAMPLCYARHGAVSPSI